MDAFQAFGSKEM